MKIKLNNVFVGDQEKALLFYTETQGFQKKIDIPMGEFRRLTVVSPEEPQASELLLEPTALPAAKVFQKAIYESGIQLASFEVDDINLEFERLTKLGVEFHSEPTDVGGAMIAVLDDTCGNLIQIYQADE